MCPARWRRKGYKYILQEAAAGAAASASNTASIGLDYQESVSRIGGTNTKEFFLESVNAETTLISLPLTSMHTAIETMDWRDIESTIEIMLNLIVNVRTIKAMSAIEI